MPIAGITIGMFFLCFAGAALTKVQQEKSMPCELNVASGATKLSDSAIAEISKIADVTAATPFLTVPAAIKTGDYSAELTLTGIAPGYLNNGFKAGGEFPAGSVMPYIVLNGAACKSFGSGKSGMWAAAENQEPDIDWLNAEFNVLPDGGEKPVISKVCGILSGEEEGRQPLAYISISCAKDLLRRGNRSADYIGANVRIKNIGCSEGVTKEIELRGLSVSNPGAERQREWDVEMKEIAYLIAAGAFSLICAAVLMAAYRKMFGLERKGSLQMLRWIGMKEKAAGGIFIMQALMISLIGDFLGIAAGISLPSFLQPGQNEASVFTLPIPFTVIAAGAAISLFISLSPLLIAGNRHLSNEA